MVALLRRAHHHGQLRARHVHLRAFQPHRRCPGRHHGHQGRNPGRHGIGDPGYGRRGVRHPARVVADAPAHAEGVAGHHLRDGELLRRRVRRGQRERRLPGRPPLQQGCARVHQLLGLGRAQHARARRRGRELPRPVQGRVRQPPEQPHQPPAERRSRDRVRPVRGRPRAWPELREPADRLQLRRPQPRRRRVHLHHAARRGAGLERGRHREGDGRAFEVRQRREQGRPCRGRLRQHREHGQGGQRRRALRGRDLRGHPRRSHRYRDRPNALRRLPRLRCRQRQAGSGRLPRGQCHDGGRRSVRPSRGVHLHRREGGGDRLRLRRQDGRRSHRGRCRQDARRRLHPVEPALGAEDHREAGSRQVVRPRVGRSLRHRSGARLPGRVLHGRRLQDARERGQPYLRQQRGRGLVRSPAHRPVGR